MIAVVCGQYGPISSDTHPVTAAFANL
jgi:hypothetical protein